MFKLKLFTLLFLAIQVVFANGGEDLGRGMDQESTYSITKTVDNKKLKVNETQLIISFNCGKDQCILKNTNFKMNGISVESKPNKRGVIIYKFKTNNAVIQINTTGFTQLNTDTIKFKSQSTVYMTVRFEPRHTNTRKPVIYLYPEKKEEVSIKLDYNGKLEFTYPTYNNGWNVTANPDGTIESNGKVYNYLFWDGKMETAKLKFDLNEGFVVKSTQLTAFLDSTLTCIGLNSKEMADFITYWVPDMMQNEQNYIHFILNKDYDQIASIQVNPKPNSQLRLFMLWTNFPPDGMPRVFIPQTLPNFKRTGFSLIEWGGSEITGLFDIITH